MLTGLAKNDRRPLEHGRGRMGKGKRARKAQRKVMRTCGDPWADLYQSLHAMVRDTYYRDNVSALLHFLTQIGVSRPEIQELLDPEALQSPGSPTSSVTSPLTLPPTSPSVSQQDARSVA